MWTMFKNSRRWKMFVICMLFVVFISCIIAIFKKAPLPFCYPKMQDNAFTSTRTVRLEELPVGDRIGEQLSYVPKGYKYDEAPVKRILVYNGRGFVWEIIQPHQAQFVGCPVSRCWITFDQEDGPEVDAVLFRHSFSRPAFEKPPNQLEQLHAIVVGSVPFDSGRTQCAQDYYESVSDTTGHTTSTTVTYDRSSTC